MSYTRIAARGGLRRLVNSLTLSLIVIAVAIAPFKATTDGFSTQLVQSIDLSAASANIQLLGAGDADHLFVPVQADEMRSRLCGAGPTATWAGGRPRCSPEDLVPRPARSDDEGARRGS